MHTINMTVCLVAAYAQHQDDCVLGLPATIMLIVDVTMS